MSRCGSSTLIVLEGPLPNVYCLEFAGEADAFAAREARSAAAGVRQVAPGLALADAVSREQVRGLAYTRRVSSLLGRTDADLERARRALESAPLDREGSVAVRAVDARGSTGISTSHAERVLGQVLVDRGFSVDLEEPDHVLRAAFSEGTLEAAAGGADGDDSSDAAASVCTLGWLVAESVRDFATRAPTDKPFFQPGSMDPLLARAVANVAGARPGATLLDPMCGTGGLLLEAALVGANVVGSDAQAKMVAGARENFGHYLSSPETPTGVEPGSFHVLRGDATSLPLPDGAADAVVFDAPYGRQSKIATHRLEDLVGEALAEARRVADRAVVVADRSWASEAREAGWTLESSFERRVHRSLTRYVLVLE